MSTPNQSVCSPWATVADVGTPCDDYTFAGDVLEEALAAASDILFELSGKQFPGTCAETLRPCARSIYDDGPIDAGRSALAAGAWAGRAFRGWCSCNRTLSGCGCSHLSEITLGGLTIDEITEIRVDGEVLDPAQYRVDDWKWLVRLADDDGTNPGWPCCQRLDLPVSEPGTFQVAFTYGIPPPPAGVWAAAELGCQLALARSPQAKGKCALPRRVTNVVRQGVSYSVLDPMDFLQDGKTGLYQADLFLSAYNPSGKRQRAQVVNVDNHRRNRRTDTGAASP